MIFYIILLEFTTVKLYPQHDKLNKANIKCFRINKVFNIPQIQPVNFFIHSKGGGSGAM